LTDEIGTSGLVKVFFRLDADDWHGHSSESMWAEPVSGSDAGDLYRLQNSPFFTRGVSFLDVVRAELSDYFDGGRLEAVEFIDRSGHSTYMVICQTDLERFKQRWELLEALGCTYESTTLSVGLLYSVDAPPATDLVQVDEVLMQGVRDGVWICQDGAVRRDGRQTGGGDGVGAPQ
jgi:hypothetical protein